MTDEDKNMANAAMLMDEKITERIIEAMGDDRVMAALLSRPAFQQFMHDTVHKACAGALQQMADRVRPNNTYGYNAWISDHTNPRFY